MKILKLPLLIISTIVLVLVAAFPVNSKTLDEIEKELEDKQGELSSLEDELEKAKNSALYYESLKNSSVSEMEKVENELKQIEAELLVNEAELEKFKQEIEILDLELEQNKLGMNERLVDLYIYNRQGIVDVLLENGQMDGFWKDYKYQETLLDNDLRGIESLAEEMSVLEGKKREFEVSITVLQEENEKLAERINILEEQKGYYSSMAAYSTDRQEGIRAQMGVVQQEIEGLSEEQKRLIEEETGIIKDAHGGTKPLESGEFYFYGRGRAIYQGHGLGFSQYGGFGGAQSGMSAQQLATFYYPGSYIGSHIDPVVEDRIKYLGEIPDKACGTSQQVLERPDKYALDDPNTIWDCWPEESIKAQIIVARSYAYTGGTQQVYKSYKGKEWAVNETSGQVLKHHDSYYRDKVIKAFFSADNNNGWGTATHRYPVWCWTFSGDNCVGDPWLQAVNDSSFAAKGPYTDWMWRTNSYSLSEIQSMFEWYANRGYYNSGNVRQLLNTIGNLQNFQIQRDVSGRAAKIKAVGSSGSADINGEIFKEIWNLWVGNLQPSGEVDPIFSITYHFVQVP